jgi:hypothetical protein
MASPLMRKDLALRAALCFSIILFFISLIPAVEAQRASNIYFNYDNDSFWATGNWIPADPNDKPGFPSETEIDCFRSSKNCVEAIAEFYMWHPHITLNYLDIIKWDRDGIIARDSSKICMTVTMQITFAEKRISSTHSIKRLDDEKKKACNFLGADKTEEDIFVLKGSERWNKEHSFLPQKPRSQIDDRERRLPLLRMHRRESLPLRSESSRTACRAASVDGGMGR